MVTILAVIGMNGIHANAQTKSWHGLDYDEARNPANVSQIEQLIDTIAKTHGNYIKLHLTDDEDFAIESQTLGQTTDKYPTMKNGLHYNSKTKKLFLSKNQLSQLIQYGQSKQVTVIPEIDVPGHVEGLHAILKTTNSALDKKVYDASNNQLKFSSATTQKFVNQLFGEYLPILPLDTPVGTGGDELIISGNKARKALLKFDNNLNAALVGHPMWIYNDSALKLTYKQLNKNILIEYWSQSEDKSSASVSASNIKINASPTELLKSNHKVINTNSYFLYLLAEKSFTSQKNYKYYVKDLNKYWGENIFNAKTFYQKVSASKNIAGSAVSIWYDSKPELSVDKTIKSLKPWITAYLKRINAGKLTVK
ncbi:family 20 glycosylhydrolase [Nicoliella lavandulae]|uniref:Family 20 glycosylhydrolase n=1 Tax=Nicoliella lavandulae TaxID=3082954 RepID=A0ABU8SMJ1_9LACO